jgi:hypothetical protein
VNTIKHELRYAQRRVGPFPAARVAVSDDKHSRLPLENLPHGIVAKAPKGSDFVDRVVALHRGSNSLGHLIKLESGSHSYAALLRCVVDGFCVSRLACSAISR